ncbi:MAG: hypothetical protein IPH12_12840 [Saprospirales bacterium]|nr:hypothetical protein [Saprospirales bacterium]
MSKLLPELVIWGGTGNFKVLCELLKEAYRIAGYFDNNPSLAPEYRGIPNLGNGRRFSAGSTPWERPQSRPLS